MKNVEQAPLPVLVSGSQAPAWEPTFMQSSCFARLIKKIISFNPILKTLLIVSIVIICLGAICISLTIPAYRRAINEAQLSLADSEILSWDQGDLEYAVQGEVPRSCCCMVPEVVMTKAFKLFSGKKILPAFNSLSLDAKSQGKVQ